MRIATKANEVVIIKNNGKKYILYVHTNLINNKRYVGITSAPKPEYRWGTNGTKYSKNPLFYRAINKYGWDNFRHDVLFTNLSEEEAIEAEKRMIAILRTYERDFGYNLTTGGEGTAGYYPSAETRAKLSKAQSRENLSEETLRKRSESLKGRKFSEEHKRKIGDGNSKPIQMFSLDGVLIRTFNSAREAEVELGIFHSHISQCCHNHRQTSGGYRWQFAQ